MNARVAILADYFEEGWASMDHYAAMLEAHLKGVTPLEASVVRPPFNVRLRHMPLPLPGPRHGHTLDRYWNRYIDYPRWAKHQRGFDLFHVLDQTYAHVAARLPAGRVVLTCHDLDFMEPPPGTRKAWLVRAMGRFSLGGFRRAARVICDSETIRSELVQRDWADPSRVVVAPMGVEDEFRPEGPLELPAPVEQILAGRTPNVLHVGAMTVRKRIDLLLRTFAVIQRSFPKAMLVRVGGSLSPEMRSLARELGVEPAIGTLPFLSRGQLAAVFRRADLFLFTSDREGFGLPVLEAMASGLPVVSRAIPAVQEVAGDSIWSVRGADHEALGEAAITLLKSPDTRTSLRQRGIERAAAFRWEHTARRTARVYEDVLAAL